MVLRAKQSFAVGHRVYAIGALVADKDPVVKGREALFESADSRVEQATAAPGEQRIGTRRDDRVIATRAPKARKAADPKDITEVE